MHANSDTSLWKNSESLGKQGETMKSQPLTKKKILVLNISHPMVLGNIVLLGDVKDAVEWLLEEIEKEQEKLKEQHKKARKSIQRAWIGGAIGGLEIVKDLTKKAFEGVLERNLKSPNSPPHR